MEEDQWKEMELARSRLLLARELKREFLLGAAKPRTPMAGIRALNKQIDRCLVQIEGLAPGPGRSATRRTVYPYLERVLWLAQRCAAREQIDFLVDHICSTRAIRRRANDSVFSVVIAATSHAPRATRSKWAIALTTAFFDDDDTSDTDFNFEAAVAWAGGLNQYIKANATFPRRRLRSDVDINDDDDIDRDLDDEWGSDDDDADRDPDDEWGSDDDDTDRDRRVRR